MVLGVERLCLPLKQSQAVQTDITQRQSIHVSYINVALSVLGISIHEIPPECPVAISTEQRLSFSSMVGYGLCQNCSVSPYIKNETLTEYLGVLLLLQEHTHPECQGPI